MFLLSEVLGMTEKVDAQMIALEKACFSEVDVLRVQLVVMFLKAIFAAAQVMEYMCAAEKFAIEISSSPSSWRSVRPCGFSCCWLRSLSPGPTLSTQVGALSLRKGGRGLNRLALCSHP